MCLGEVGEKGNSRFYLKKTIKLWYFFVNSGRDLRFLLNICSNYIISYRRVTDYHCVAFEKFGTPLTIFGGSGLVDVWDNS